MNAIPIQGGPIQIQVGNRVLLPDTAPCQYGTVTAVGRILVDVKFDQPYPLWRERGLSDHSKYDKHRLQAVTP